MDDNERRQRQLVEGGPASLRFGDDVLQYERARPPYPEWVFDELIQGTTGLRVLDVGCGTGTATATFRERGCRILGVEPDDRMAQVAASRGIDVEVSTFEKWDPAGRVFDLVASAQAWHWVDSTIGIEKAAQVLRPGGRFGAFWNGHEHMPDVADAIRAARGFPTTGAASPPIDVSAPVSEAMESSTHLHDVDTRREAFTLAYSAAEWLDVEGSFGSNRALAPAARATLFQRIAEALARLEPIEVRWHSVLVTAQKRV